MLFDAIRRRRQEKADSQQAWLARWQSLVPEENRNVPVTVEGQTRIAYIQINLVRLPAIACRLHWRMSLLARRHWGTMAQAMPRNL